MCFIKYSTVVNENLKAQAKQFFWFARMESEKADIVLMHCLLRKYLQEKGRYNLETCLACTDCGKAFDRVKRDKLFEILQSKNIPNLLLKRVIEIYSGNKSKYTQQINRRTYTINHRFFIRLPFIINIYMNEIIVKWNQIYTKVITL